MLYPIHMRSVALLLGSVALASGQNGAQAIFENQCVSCHGTAPMSGLDLRQRDTILKGGKRGPAVVPGKPDESLLYRAVMRQGDVQMPPGKQKLAAEDIARLRSWIEAGAPWASSTTATAESSWCAFRKMRRAAGNSIDGLILAKLQEKGLHPVAA